MLNIPTDLGVLMRDLTAYAFAPTTDPELAGKLQIMPGSAADRLFGAIEQLYAFRDRIGDDGLQLLGQCAGFCVGHGWTVPGEPDRLTNIHQGVLRDLGVAGTYDFADPQPAPFSRDDNVDWRELNPEQTLEKKRAAMIARMKAVRSEKENADAPTTFGAVQADQESKLKINGLSTAALAAKALGAPFEVGFILADNSVVQLSADDAISFGVQVATHVSNIYAYSIQLRAQIEAATTIEELDAIDVETNWP